MIDNKEWVVRGATALGDSVIILSVMEYFGIRNLYLTEDFGRCQKRIEELAEALEFDIRVELDPERPMSPHTHNTWQNQVRSIIQYPHKNKKEGYVTTQRISTEKHRSCSEEVLLSCLDDRPTVSMDEHRSFKEAFDILSCAEAHVGVDSGWPWAALCCSLPTTIIVNPLVDPSDRRYVVPTHTFGAQVELAERKIGI